MQYQFYVGIDVSKSWLDIAVINTEAISDILHFKVENNDDGLAQANVRIGSKWQGYDISKSLFCMESTGLYCYPLLQLLQLNQAAVWVENAVQIKRSIGIQRGKSDKIDALRIAQYAAKNIDNVRLWVPARAIVDKLKHLSALRDRLVQTRKKLVVPVEEFRQMGNDMMAKTLEKAMHKSIKGIEADIEGIEKQMKDIIDNDSQLKKIYALVTSVIGIGFVTAVNLIVYTNEFKAINDARKLACYCGIAPFEHTSGSSIRGRSKVSHMANKKLKTNLHMASLSSVRLDQGLKVYYERKVAEGKSKLSVLNAVKNKLIARVIAVIKRDRLYEKNYNLNALVMS